MTFSIIAYDTEMKQLGLGTASCGMFTGSICPIVCTQGEFIGTSQAYVSKVIKGETSRLIAESTPFQLLDEKLRSFDKYYEYRQLAIMKSDGSIFVHTGQKTSPESGHVKGKNFAIVGNMLTDKNSLNAMAIQFEKSKDLPLAKRLLAALEACKKEGGQKANGRLLKERAAALCVIDQEGSKMVDLRVDMSDNALAKLRNLWEAFSIYKGFMQDCEQSPENLSSLEEQEISMPMAPSIYF